MQAAAPVDRVRGPTAELALALTAAVVVRPAEPATAVTPRAAARAVRTRVDREAADSVAAQRAEAPASRWPVTAAERRKAGAAPEAEVVAAVEAAQPGRPRTIATTCSLKRTQRSKPRKPVTSRSTYASAATPWTTRAVASSPWRARILPKRALTRRRSKRSKIAPSLAPPPPVVHPGTQRVPGARAARRAIARPVRPVYRRCSEPHATRAILVR
jgi:hypothetical protein